jgi:hypothetical protein
VRPSAESQAVFERAKEAEKTSMQRAIKLYEESARLQNGFAAKRLSDIYDRGVPGVPRDTGQWVYWNEIAYRLGAPAWVGNCGAGR